MRLARLGDVAIPAWVIVLIFALEARGVNFRLNGDRLEIRPRGSLLPTEVDALRKNRRSVIRLVRHLATERAS